MIQPLGDGRPAAIQKAATKTSKGKKNSTDGVPGNPGGTEPTIVDLGQVVHVPAGLHPAAGDGFEAATDALDLALLTVLLVGDPVGDTILPALQAKG